MSLDYRAYPILYVDDEAANLVAVRYALEDSFTILTATGGEEALRILAEQDVAVLLSDQRMPGMGGVELCEKARELRPDTVRIILTAYADLHAAIDAINRGQVSRYLAKPFRTEELSQVLQTAIELVHIHRTMRDMEVRLLRSGQATTARTVSAELGHELNNYVSMIGLNLSTTLDLVETARRRLQGDPSALAKVLDDIAEAQADASAALDQLTGLVRRLRRGDKEPVRVQVRTDAARVLDSTARILRAEIQRHARFRIVLEGSPIVPMDATSLGQVIMNLLLNAAQALGEEAGPEDEIVARIATQGDRAVITVADTGPGIAPEAMPRIFDAYFTTKKEGTGLGLAIVRDLVERAGGSLRAENRADGGALFTVELPTVSYSTAPPPSA